jgi:hypothetical protein
MSTRSGLAELAHDRIEVDGWAGALVGTRMSEELDVAVGPPKGRHHDPHHGGILGFERVSDLP